MERNKSNAGPIITVVIVMLALVGPMFFFVALRDGFLDFLFSSAEKAELFTSLQGICLCIGPIALVLIFLLTLAVGDGGGD